MPPSWEIVNSNPDKPWHGQYLTSNKNLKTREPFDFIKKYYEGHRYCMKDTSCHPSITWEIVQSNPDIPTA